MLKIQKRFPQKTGNFRYEKVAFFLVLFFCFKINITCCMDVEVLPESLLGAIRYATEQQRLSLDPSTVARWFDETMDLKTFRYTCRFGIFPHLKAQETPRGSRIAVVGDLHGDDATLPQICDLLAEEGFFTCLSGKLLAEDFQIVFLGDYADKGPKGLGVWSQILELKNRNPNQVFITRGNHECARVHARQSSKPGQHTRFYQEIIQEFGICEGPEIFESFLNFYRFLQFGLVLKCGKSYIVCCHGGIPECFNFEPFVASGTTHMEIPVVLESYPMENIPNFLTDSPFSPFLMDDFLGIGEFTPDGIVHKRDPKKDGARKYVTNDIGVDGVNSILLSNPEIVAAIRGHEHTSRSTSSPVSIFTKTGTFQPVDSGEPTKIAELCQQADSIPVFNVVSSGQLFGGNSGFVILTAGQEVRDWTIKTFAFDVEI
jgi:hypothetical protein